MPDAPVLLSVVVPTKNRARCAIPMIRSVLSIEGPELELVVTDNSDDDALADWVVTGPADPRLRYERVRGLVSMSGNCNHAIALARGEYVILIGDDDTVLPSILPACRWARENGVDALTPDLSIRYMWPDLRHRIFGMRQAGNVYLDPWPGSLTPADSAAEALACVRRAGQGMGRMANLYHGVVRRSVLEALKEMTGDYVFGVSPDVYTSLTVTTQVLKQVHYAGPLTVPGTSGRSNAGRQAVREHTGKLWDDPHMKPFKGEAWPPEVPEFFGIETVWAQGTITACKKLGREDLLARFDFTRLYAICMLKHRESLPEIRAAMAARNGGDIPAGRWISLGFALAAEVARFGWTTFKRMLRPTPRGWSLEYGPYDNVERACEALCQRSPEGFTRFPSRFEG